MLARDIIISLYTEYYPGKISCFRKLLYILLSSVKTSNTFVFTSLFSSPYLEMFSTDYAQTPTLGKTHI